MDGKEFVELVFKRYGELNESNIIQAFDEQVTGLFHDGDRDCDSDSDSDSDLSDSVIERLYEGYGKDTVFSGNDHYTGCIYQEGNKLVVCNISGNNGYESVNTIISNCRFKEDQTLTLAFHREYQNSGYGFHLCQITNLSTKKDEYLLGEESYSELRVVNLEEEYGIDFNPSSHPIETAILKKDLLYLSVGEKTMVFFTFKPEDPVRYYSFDYDQFKNLSTKSPLLLDNSPDLTGFDNGVCQFSQKDSDFGLIVITGQNGIETTVTLKQIKDLVIESVLLVNDSLFFFCLSKEGDSSQYSSYHVLFVDHGYESRIAIKNVIDEIPECG